MSTEAQEGATYLRRRPCAWTPGRPSASSSSCRREAQLPSPRKLERTGGRQNIRSRMWVAEQRPTGRTARSGAPCCRLVAGLELAGLLELRRCRRRRRLRPGGRRSFSRCCQASCRASHGRYRFGDRERESDEMVVKRSSRAAGRSPLAPARAGVRTSSGAHFSTTALPRRIDRSHARASCHSLPPSGPSNPPARRARRRAGSCGRRLSRPACQHRGHLPGCQTRSGLADSARWCDRSSLERERQGSA